MAPRDLQSPDAGDPASVLERYFERANAHDVEGAVECLSDEFRLAFEGGPTLDRAGIRRALGWDAGTRGRVTWEIVAREDDAIVVEGEETNAFLEQLGQGPLAFRSRFRFDGDGRIAHQHHTVATSDIGLDEALAPVVVWAGEHAPGELAEIYPDDRIDYSEDSGRRWVDLLERWRAAGSPGASAEP